MDVDDISLANSISTEQGVPNSMSTEQGVPNSQIQQPISVTADGISCCSAVLKSGAPCTYRGTRDGGVCGVHARQQTLKDIAKEECAICLGSISSRRSCRSLSCKHVFHKRCIRRWFGRGTLTCPTCRSVCLENLCMNGSALHVQIRVLLRTIPPPPNAYFPTFMMSLLGQPRIVQALHLTDDLRQLLVELAFFSFTQAQFLRFLDQFRFV